MENEMRLQKWLAECGVASRRGAEEMIAAGEITVDGKRAQIGDKVDPSRAKILVKGQPLAKKERNVYIMLHKPRGYITTMKDEMQRKCVAELVRDIPERVYPVGRLDRESEGLLLMTNDGAFANALTHPSSHVAKVYRVTVERKVTEDELAKMSAGMELDGYQTAPCEVNVLLEEENRCVLEIRLFEGRNRQIRNMCEKLGLDVKRLKRISEGNVKLGMLKVGEWRELTDKEIKSLQKR